MGSQGQSSDRVLVVNYERFKITVLFNSDEEVNRAKRGMLLLQSGFNLCKGGKLWWDGMTSQQRTTIEADADWLNNRITEAKLEHAYGNSQSHYR